MNAEISKCDVGGSGATTLSYHKARRTTFKLSDVAGRLLIDFNVSPEKTVSLLLDAGHTPIEVAEALYAVMPNSTPAKIAACLPRECLLPDGSVPRRRNRPGTPIMVILPTDAELESWGVAR